MVCGDLVELRQMGKLGIKIDRASSRTLTDQLTDGLRTAIRIGNLKDGETLPTREELVARLGVSKNVVQTAVARLVAEGLVCSRPHSGCRVIRPGSRPMRGHVLEVVTGSELPFWNVRFSESFRRTLYEARISCSGLGLVYDRNNRFDRGQLEYELARRPDIVVIKSTDDRVAGIQRYFDQKGIPYVLMRPSSGGRHPFLQCELKGADSRAIEEFVADCRASDVHSVLCLSSTGRISIDPRPALESAGIAVESMTSFKGGKSVDLDLDVYMAQARDCMLERLKRGPLCDLLFSSDDYLTMGALPALLENGVRIPQDLRVVTYYNSGFGPILTKTFARIERDYRSVGCKLAEGVIAWFKTGKVPPLTMPTFEYVRGETFPVVEQNRRKEK